MNIDYLKLSGPAKKYFQKILKAAKADDLQISIIDLSLLAVYCSEITVYRQSMEAVLQEGGVIDFEQGAQKLKVENPNYKVASQALRNAKAAIQKLDWRITDLFEAE
jgi:P27 family predicted phage terminase small subunit